MAAYAAIHANCLGKDTTQAHVLQQLQVQGAGRMVHHTPRVANLMQLRRLADEGYKKKEILFRSIPVVRFRVANTI